MPTFLSNVPLPFRGRQFWISASNAQHCWVGRYYFNYDRFDLQYNKKIRRRIAPKLLRHMQPDHNRQKEKRQPSPFPQQMWPLYYQELPWHNLYFHWGSHLQCSSTQLHRTSFWEVSQKEWFSKKSIHNITNSDNPTNSRRGFCKKPWSNTYL